MKFLLPAAAALLALTLTACQAEPPPAEAQAVAVDAIVATAVSDVRSAAIDPVTGKARDARAVFTALSADAGAGLAPSMTLGEQTPGAPGTQLDLNPAAGGGGEPTF